MIVIVSGLPRSGTSMMLQMLQAGGMTAMSDRARPRDADNPNGYLELDCLKRLEVDTAWLRDADGKALKVISALLPALPLGYDYRVIFMERDLQEVLASQAAMLARLGKPAATPDEELMRLFQAHLREVRQWLDPRPHFKVLTCNYAAVVLHPQESAAAVAAFVGLALDVGKMADAVAPALWRQRRA